MPMDRKQEVDGLKETLHGQQILLWIRVDQVVACNLSLAGGQEADTVARTHSCTQTLCQCC